MWREFGGEVVILELESQHYFGLTGSGNDIWQMIAEYGSSDEIIERLRAKYDVDPENLRADFENFVQELTTKGMVRVLATD